MAKIRIPSSTESPWSSNEPSEEVLQNQFENLSPSLLGAIGSGFWEGVKVVGGAAIKILDIPRIITTDVGGNLFEALFEAGFDLSKGMPEEAAYAFGRNLREAFTDTASDVFTTNLETRVTGSTVLKDLYNLGTGDDKAYDNMSGALKFTLSLGIELFQDPTTFIGVGAVKTLAGKSATKVIAREGLENCGKFITGIKALSQDTRTVKHVSSILQAPDVTTAVKMIDDLTSKFGIKLDQIAENKVASELGDVLLDPQMQKVFGYNFNPLERFGTRSSNGRKLAVEYGRRAGSNYDQVVAGLSNKSVDELVDMGFSREVAQKFADTGYMDIGIDYLNKIVPVTETGMKQLSTSEIIESARNYGNWITEYKSLHNPNPNAHYWAFWSDHILDDGASGVFTRSANNVSMMLGMSDFANPLWYGKKLLYNPLNVAYMTGQGASVKATLKGVGRSAQYLATPIFEPVKTVKSLYGRVTSSFATDAGKVIADPTLGMQVGSRGWLDNIAGKYSLFGAGPEFQPIAEHGFDMATTSYGIQTQSMISYLRQYSDAIIPKTVRDAASGLERPLTHIEEAKYAQDALDMIQLNKEQWAVRQVLGDDLEAYPAFMKELQDSTIEEMIAKTRKQADLDVLNEALIHRNNYKAAEYAEAFQYRMENLRRMENEFGIAEMPFEGPLRYLPNAVSEGATGAIEEAFMKAGRMDLFNSITNSTKSEIRDLFISQVRQKDIRDLPISVVNNILKNGTAKQKDDLFGYILEPFAHDVEAYKLARKGLDEHLKLDGAQFYATDLNELITKRMRRHYTAAQMSGIVGSLDQHGLIQGIGRAELAELRKMAAPAGVTIQEQRLAASKVGRGVRYELTSDMEQVAEQLGYEAVVDSKTGKKSWWNITPRDLKEIAKNAESANLTSKQADDLWAFPKDQQISSADTSINSTKLPASTKKIPWRSGTVNADIGGGRFDNVTDYLKDQGVENVIYDPFNRTSAHNATSVKKIAGGQADTATVNNVLNVIKEPAARSRVIQQAADAVKDDGTAYFLMHEGNKSGVGKPTTKGWQENRTAASYEAEVRQYFATVDRKGNMLIAKDPIKSKPVIAAVTTEPKVKRYYKGRPSEDILIKDIADETNDEHWSKILSSGLPKITVPEGKELIVTRQTIMNLLNRRDLLSPKVEQKLWDMANNMPYGFAHISADVLSHTEKTGLNASYILHAARRAGLDDNVLHLIDSATSQQMEFIANQINSSTMRKNLPMRMLSGLTAILQQEKLWGFSTFMANVLGNPIFAHQGGMTLDYFSHSKHATMYMDVLLKGKPKDMEKIFIKELNMTLAEVVEKMRGYEMIGRGWVRETFEAMQEGGLHNYKSFEKIMAQNKKGLWHGIKKVLGTPAMLIGATADDGWRFIYAMDCLTNRGMSFEETAAMVKKAMGDFNPEKLTRADKATASMMYFYRFRKWNMLNQSKILATDPKWASFIGKTMRAHQSVMDDTEKVVAKVMSPDFVDWSVAYRLDGNKDITWDRDGKLQSAEYAVYNPFGSWYPTHDMLAWTNPMKEAFNATIFGADLDPSTTGFGNALWAGISNLGASLAIDDPEKKAKMRSNGLAALTNSSRILRYLRPMIKEEEGWRDTKRRLTRGLLYKNYVDLKEAVSKSRSKLSTKEQGAYDHTMRRLNRIMYDLRPD